MKKISIIIPAYNEEKRIGRTLQSYASYFASRDTFIPHELIVVLNGCVDNTAQVVSSLQAQYPSIRCIQTERAGKGLALAHGFRHALAGESTHIGFVDADMATQPEYFNELLTALEASDGIIASRYMKESKVTPPRPALKRWGSRLVYEPLVRVLFKIRYADYQCGAKLFKREVIEKITPHLTVAQWAFDVELLYLCKKNGFTLKEIPTTWHDQADSKLRVGRAGWRMISSLFRIWYQHR